MLQPRGYWRIFPFGTNWFLNLPSKQLRLHNHIQLRYQICVCKKTCLSDALRKANNQITDYLQKSLMLSKTLNKKLTCTNGQKTSEYLQKKKKRKEAAADILLRSAGNCRNMHSWHYVHQTGEAMLDNMSWSKNLINFPKLWQDYRLAVKPASMYHGSLCTTERNFISW